MSKQEVQTLPGRKTSSKLIAGIAAFLATGIITMSGVAGAEAPRHSQSPNSDAQNSSQANNIGNGYGGGNTSVAVNLDINNSNNNIINIIVRVFE